MKLRYDSRMCAGILGAHAVLFATSMCIILVDMIEGRSVFGQWYTYLVSVCYLWQTAEMLLR